MGRGDAWWLSAPASSEDEATDFVSEGRASGTAGARDVEPIAGRVVVFQSGLQMHEVLESAAGADRVALTLWVEYEDSWQREDTALASLEHGL